VSVPAWIVTLIVTQQNGWLGLFMVVVSVVVTVAAVNPQSLCSEQQQYRIIIGNNISYGISKEAFERSTDLRGQIELRETLQSEGLTGDISVSYESHVLQIYLTRK